MGKQIKFPFFYVNSLYNSYFKRIMKFRKIMKTARHNLPVFYSKFSSHYGNP